MKAHFRIADGSVLVLSSYSGERERAGCLISSYKGINSIMRTLPLGLYLNLAAFQKAHFQIPLHLGLGCQLKFWRDTNNQSMTASNSTS